MLKSEIRLPLVRDTIPLNESPRDQLPPSCSRIICSPFQFVMSIAANLRFAEQRHLREDFQPDAQRARSPSVDHCNRSAQWEIASLFNCQAPRAARIGLNDWAETSLFHKSKICSNRGDKRAIVRALFQPHYQNRNP